MILTCKRDALLNACQIAGVAIPARTTMPIYKNFLCVAEDGVLSIVATDLEVGIRYEINDVTIEEPGRAVIPADRLMAIIRETSDDSVRIDADKRRTKVHTVASNYEMGSEDPAAFSDIAEFEDDEKFFEMSGSDLQVMVRRTSFAAAKDEGRFAMKSVMWDVDSKRTNLVATDGKRLAIASVSSKNVTGQSVSGGTHLVPPKAMQLLERILTDGDVKVSLRANDAIFRTEQALIYSRLVEGRFPPYQNVVPKNVNAKILMPVGELLSAVKQAAIMTDAESKRIAFSFSSGSLTMKAGTGAGFSRVDMKIDYDGPKIEINLDPAYLTEMLRVMDQKAMAQLDLVNGEKPGVFRFGPEYLYLVAPLV